MNKKRRRTCKNYRKVVKKRQEWRKKRPLRGKRDRRDHEGKELDPICNGKQN